MSLKGYVVVWTVARVDLACGPLFRLSRKGAEKRLQHWQKRLGPDARLRIEEKRLI